MAKHSLARMTKGPIRNALWIPWPGIRVIWHIGLGYLIQCLCRNAIGQSAAEMSLRSLIRKVDVASLHSARHQRAGRVLDNEIGFSVRLFGIRLQQLLVST